MALPRELRSPPPSRPSAAAPRPSASRTPRPTACSSSQPRCRAAARGRSAAAPAALLGTLHAAAAAPSCPRKPPSALPLAAPLSSQPFDVAWLFKDHFKPGGWEGLPGGGAAQAAWERAPRARLCRPTQPPAGPTPTATRAHPTAGGALEHARNPLPSPSGYDSFVSAGEQGGPEGELPAAEEARRFAHGGALAYHWVGARPAASAGGGGGHTRPRAREGEGARPPRRTGVCWGHTACGEPAAPGEGSAVRPLQDCVAAAPPARSTTTGRSHRRPAAGRTCSTPP